ncbi:MAG: PAS domain S-box protein [Desulfobacterales bacterium]|nr:PAS domain S-box protein [Desulfobacterales bacterium]
MADTPTPAEINHSSSRPRPALILTICIGVAMTLSMHAALQNLEQKRMKENFHSHAQRRVEAIERAILIKEHILHSLRSFYDASIYVDRDEFAICTASFLKHHHGLQTLSWAPRVPRADRMGMEIAARRNGLDAFQFTERDADGRMAPAGEREAYFPAYYIEPYRGNKIEAGYDFGSDAMWRHALERAMDTGRTAAVIPEKRESSGSPGKEPVIFFFTPVYKQLGVDYTLEGRRKSHKGFIMGVLNVGETIEAALAPLAREGLDVILADQTKDLRYRTIFHHKSRAREGEMDQNDHGRGHGPGDLKHEAFIHVADQRCQLSLTAIPAFISQYSTLLPEAGFVMGLLLTIGIAMHLMNNLRRTRQVMTLAKALTESKKRYKEFAEFLPMAAFETDKDGGLIFGNRTAFELFGYDGKEREKVRDISGLLVPGDRERAMKNLRRELAGKKLGKMEYTGRTIDGRQIPIMVHINRIIAGGEPTGIRGVVVDLTERKQAEREASRLRNLLKSIIDSMPSIIVGVNAEGKITHWNTQAEKSTGASAREARGRLLSEALPGLVEEMARVYESIRDRQPFKDEKVPLTVNGETRYSDVNIYPLAADVMEGAVIRIDDVTERVRMEEMMIQSEKMMSVGGLAAGMAHEINNPLAGVMQNVQVMKNRMNKDLPKNRRTAEACGGSMDVIDAYMSRRGFFGMIESVLACGRRARKIVDNMLTFSRVSKSMPVPRDLTELMDKTIELVENDYDLRKKFDFLRIEIVREYDAGTPDVPCERGKIQQVFLNILKNGAEAMAKNVPAPRFILRVRPDGEMVRVEIEDNGPGMEEETRKRIFEPFFTTGDVGVGTGLGLSVSYFLITRSHGGAMTAESAPGRGTKFVIRLPLKHNSDAGRESRESK